MRNKKIALIGVQGTGKSTLLNALTQDNQMQEEFVKGANGVYITEVVRSLVRERGISINRDASHKSQMIILEAHYFNALKNTSFITDRGAIDAFAYAVYNYLAGKFTYSEHQEHRELFEACLPYYTHFYYLPIEFKVENDGFRDTDETFRQEVDRIYQDLFQRYAMPEFVTLTGTVEQRVELFKETWVY